MWFIWGWVWILVLLIRKYVFSVLLCFEIVFIVSVFVSYGFILFEMYYDRMEGELSGYFEDFIIFS